MGPCQPSTKPQLYVYENLLRLYSTGFILSELQVSVKDENFLIFGPFSYRTRIPRAQNGWNNFYYSCHQRCCRCSLIGVFGNQLFLSRMNNCHFRSPAISNSCDLYRLNLYKRILPILYSAETIYNSLRISTKSIYTIYQKSAQQKFH